MAGKRDKPEDIVLKLRQIEVLHGQGMAISDAVRQIGVTGPTYYRWRKQYGGMNRDQLKRLKELERENQRLRRAVSDQTSNKKRRPLGRRSRFPLYLWAQAFLRRRRRVRPPKPPSSSKPEAGSGIGAISPARTSIRSRAPSTEML